MSLSRSAEDLSQADLLAIAGQFLKK